MKYLVFKQNLSEFCKEYGIKFPCLNYRLKLHQEYEKSLYTAPVPDDENTLEEFLMNTNWSEVFESNSVELAPLPCAVPTPCEMSKKTLFWGSNPKEEITPMRYNETNSYANASVSATKSDIQISRDYLAARLDRAEYPKTLELREFFNMFVDNTPKTYKQMIDIIKAGTYTIDPKIAKRVEALGDDEAECHGPLHGIIFPGPKQDYDGFCAAQITAEKEMIKARDVIMTGSAVEGLAAVQAFEAWLPTPATTA